MSQFFTKFSRQGICKHFTRSYCYKPIERKIFSAKEPSANDERERKWQKIDKREKYFFSNNETNGPQSLQIVETLPSDPKDFTEDKLIDAFDRLSAYTIGEDALVHGNYDALIEATKLILPKLNRTQCVHIFTQMCRAKIPMFDELCEMVVYNLCERVDSSISHIYYLNEENYESFTVDEIVAIDLALRDYYQRRNKLSVLFDTLRKWMRNLFAFKMEHNVNNFSFKELIRAMRYLSSNATLIQSFDTTPLFQQLITVNDNEFQLADVACILVTMLRFQELNEYGRQVLNKMFKMWCNKATDFNDALIILQKFHCYKPTDGNYDFTSFLDANFIHCCVQLTIQSKDYTNGLCLLKCFHDLGIVNVELIDYISPVFHTKKHKNTLTGNDYVHFIEACSKTNYTPSNWKSQILPAIENVPINPKLIVDPSAFAVTLKKMEIYNKGFREYSERSEKIETQEGFTESTEPSTFSPSIASDLKKFVGANKVLYDVPIMKDLTVQIVMKANTKTGDFLDMNKGTPKENLLCKKNEVIIAVLVDEHAAKSRIDSYEQKKILETKGFHALLIEEKLYKIFPQTYKRAYILFELIVGGLKYMKNKRNKK